METGESYGRGVSRRVLHGQKDFRVGKPFFTRWTDTDQSVELKGDIKLTLFQRLLSLLKGPFMLKRTMTTLSSCSEIRSLR